VSLPQTRALASSRQEKAQLTRRSTVQTTAAGRRLRNRLRRKEQRMRQTMISASWALLLPIVRNLWPRPL